MDERKLEHLIDAAVVNALLAKLNTSSSPKDSIEDEAATLIARGLVAMSAERVSGEAKPPGSSLDTFAKIGLGVTATGTDKSMVKLASAEDFRQYALKVVGRIPPVTNPGSPVTICVTFYDGSTFCWNQYY
jgi:hypothetical protein